MTTATTNTTFSHASSAAFQAWVNEIYTGLVTSCGLTQTADTGQMAVPCVTTLPGTNTTGGYYIFRFNDTLQATSPVFIKLEFGTGAGAANPRLFITVASATDGAGNLSAGLTQCTTGFTSSTITNPGVANYVSRFCYNATQGYCGMAFKIGGSGTATTVFFGFHIFRSVDNTGAPTSTAVHLLTNSLSTTVNNSGGNMQIYDYSTTAALSLTTATAWVPNIPFGAAGTLQGTTGQIFPVWQYAPTATVPGYGITNALGLGVNTEIALGATVPVTVLGSTSLTYINVAGGIGGNNTIGQSGLAVATYGVLMLWT